MTRIQITVLIIVVVALFARPLWHLLVDTYYWLTSEDTGPLDHDPGEPNDLRPGDES